MLPFDLACRQFTDAINFNLSLLIAQYNDYSLAKCKIYPTIYPLLLNFQALIKTSSFSTRQPVPTALSDDLLEQNNDTRHRSLLFHNSVVVRVIGIYPLCQVRHHLFFIVCANILGKICSSL